MAPGPKPGVPRREVGAFGPKSGTSFHALVLDAFDGGGTAGEEVKFRGGGGTDCCCGGW